jgi:hypothetical protein
MHGCATGMNLNCWLQKGRYVFEGKWYQKAI